MRGWGSGCHAHVEHFISTRISRSTSVPSSAGHYAWGTLADLAGSRLGATVSQKEIRCLACRSAGDQISNEELFPRTYWLCTNGHLALWLDATLSTVVCALQAYKEGWRVAISEHAQSEQQSQPRRGCILPLWSVLTEILQHQAL